MNVFSADRMAWRCLGFSGIETLSKQSCIPSGTFTAAPRPSLASLEYQRSPEEAIQQFIGDLNFLWSEIKEGGTSYQNKMQPSSSASDFNKMTPAKQATCAIRLHVHRCCFNFVNLVGCGMGCIESGCFLLGDFSAAPVFPGARLHASAPVLSRHSTPVNYPMPGGLRKNETLKCGNEN